MSVFKRAKHFVMQRSRRGKLDHFYSLCDRQSSILDVGVSNNEHDETINFLLKNFALHDN